MLMTSAPTVGCLLALAGPAAGLDAALDFLATLAPAGSFFWYTYNLRALVALVLVSLACGAVGPLVVGALAPLPVVVGILVIFAQLRLGSGAAVVVLAGAARGSQSKRQLKSRSVHHSAPCNSISAASE